MNQALSRAAYPTVIPYLIVQDAPALIEFVKRVFGAEEVYRTIGGAGGVHAEVRLGDSILMIGGGAADNNWHGNSETAALHLYLDDVQSPYQRAMRGGATSLLEPTELPGRGYSADFKDPFGNTWYLSRREQAAQPPS